jgi:hypothetical protein
VCESVGALDSIRHVCVCVCVCVVLMVCMQCTRRFQVFWHSRVVCERECFNYGSRNKPVCMYHPQLLARSLKPCPYVSPTTSCLYHPQLFARSLKPCPYVSPTTSCKIHETLPHLIYWPLSLGSRKKRSFSFSGI